MNANNIVNCFFVRFPELKSNYLNNCENNLINNDDGLYIIWSFGIVPCIIELMKDYEENKIMLNKIFDFFEEMATSDVEELKELLMYSILEELGDNRATLLNARQFMKQNTLHYSYQVEEFLGREPRK